MVHLISRLFRVTLILAVVACSQVSGDSSGDSSDNQPVAYQAVRIRKMHLVRPDLIPYPLALEVVC